MQHSLNRVFGNKLMVVDAENVNDFDKKSDSFGKQMAAREWFM